MGEKLTGRTLALGAAVIAWVSWCLVSSGAVALIVNLVATVLSKPALTSNMLAAVVVEALLLGSTAFVEFRALARFQPPSRFWLVAPAGYIASFLLYLALTRVLGDVSTSISGATLLELAAVSAVVSTGAYLAGLERGASANPAAEPREAGA